MLKKFSVKYVKKILSDQKKLLKEIFLAKTMYILVLV